MPDELNVTLEDDSPVIEVQIIGTGPVGPPGGPGPAGPEGPAGSDGVSPAVTITAIPGGHRVTITDAEHPTGQSFDVMDGDSGGGAVESVNGQTGTVVLDAEDVGALPDDTLIPSKTSDLTNDSGFVNASGAASAAPVQSVNGKTGAVSLSIPSTAADIGAAPAVTEVTVSTAGAVTQALDAGKIYHFTGALSALTLTLNAAASGVIAQYHFDFDSGSTPPTVALPNGVTMQGGTFSPEASKHYEVDILNGYGVYVAW